MHMSTRRVCSLFVKGAQQGLKVVGYHGRIVIGTALCAARSEIN
jgi:hypothetical protein